MKSTPTSDVEVADLLKSPHEIDTKIDVDVSNLLQNPHEIDTKIVVEDAELLQNPYGKWYRNRCGGFKFATKST